MNLKTSIIKKLGGYSQTEHLVLKGQLERAADAYSAARLSHDSTMSLCSALADEIATERTVHSNQRQEIRHRMNEISGYHAHIEALKEQVARGESRMGGLAADLRAMTKDRDTHRSNAAIWHHDMTALCAVASTDRATIAGLKDQVAHQINARKVLGETADRLADELQVAISIIKGANIMFDEARAANWNLAAKLEVAEERIEAVEAVNADWAIRFEEHVAAEVKARIQSSKDAKTKKPTIQETHPFVNRGTEPTHAVAV